MNFLKSLIFSSTSKDSSVLFTGIIIATFFSFVWNIILARNVDPTFFGVIMTAIIFGQLISDTFELGINSSVINFYKHDDVNSQSYLKATFLIKLITAAIISLSVFFLALPISIFFFNNAEIVSFIQISAGGIFLFMIITWFQTLFQAKRNFLSSAAVSVLINILRTFGLIGLIYFGLMNPINAFFSLQIALVITFLIILMRFDGSFLKTKLVPGSLNKVARFALPVGAGFAIAAIYTKLDQLVVFNLLGSDQAGFYAVAYRVLLPFILLVSAFNAAIAPKIASIENNKFPQYFYKIVLVSLILGILSLLLIPLIPYLLPIIFGNQYQDAILVAQILLFAGFFFILSSPFFTALLYKYKKNYFNLVIALLSLVVLYLLLQFFIPIFSTKGAAIAVCLVYALQFFAVSGYLLIIIRKR